MASKLDLTGQRFGMLVVLGEGEPLVYAPTKSTPRARVVRMWKCKCDCGNIALVGTGPLRSGGTQSCGCQSNKGKALRLQARCLGCAHASNGGNRKIFCNKLQQKLMNKDLAKLQNCQYLQPRPKGSVGVFDELSTFTSTCINCGEQFIAIRSRENGGALMYCPKCESKCRERDQQAIENLSVEGAVRIAKAIIQSARQDYVDGELAVRRGSQSGQYRHDMAKAFFNSKWFLTLSMLPDINRDILFKALDKEITRRWNNGQIDTNAEDFGDTDWD